MRYASMLFLVIIVVWPVLAILTVPTGTIESQLEEVGRKLAPYFLNFMVALLIGPSLTWMLVAYKATLTSERGRLFSAAIACYAIYLILITVSYGSQVSVLPILIHRGNSRLAMQWFFYNNRSIPIYINQNGYLIWSIGTLLLFGKHIRSESILNRLIAGLLLLSSALQIVASIGLYLNRGAMTQLSFPSGLLLIPVGILVLIQSFPQAKKP